MTAETAEQSAVSQDVYRLLRDGEALTTQQLYERSDVAESPADVARAIRELVDAADVVQLPPESGGRRSRYAVPSDPARGNGESAGASASGQAQRRRVGRREVRQVCRSRSETFTARGVAIDLGMDDSLGRECVAQILSDLARKTGEIVRLGGGWYVRADAASAGAADGGSSASAEPTRCGDESTVATEPPDVVEPERYGLTSDGHLLIYYTGQDRPTELSEDATRRLARWVAACWIGIDPAGRHGTGEARHE